MSNWKQECNARQQLNEMATKIRMFKPGENAKVSSVGVPRRK